MRFNRFSKNPRFLYVGYEKGELLVSVHQSNKGKMAPVHRILKRIEPGIKMKTKGVEITSTIVLTEEKLNVIFDTIDFMFGQG